MARTARDARLDSRNARERLKKRREPYWRTIHEGLALGYRKGASGGFWNARAYNPEWENKRPTHSIGAADDHADADGRAVFDFAQAQELAIAWHKGLAASEGGDLATGPYTVGQALDDYLANYQRRGGKAAERAKNVIEAHIKPSLGNVDLRRLRRAHVKEWHDALAEQGARVRTKLGRKPAHRHAPKTADEKRRRRATANRCLTVLKAALNHALQERRIVSDDAWASVKPFPKVEKAVIRYLSEDEARRLVNSCNAEFRPLVMAALLTGCRYGELTALTAADFNSDAGTLAVRESKSGNPRHVVLTDEAQRFFATATAGKESGALIFTRVMAARKGTGQDSAFVRKWGKSHQHRLMKDACKDAHIKPAIRFHDLRHTHGSTLAMRGVPMAVIATQLGHADTRLTEKHYAHLSPSYVADTIRAHFPVLGIGPVHDVTPARPQRPKAQKSSDNAKSAKVVPLHKGVA